MNWHAHPEAALPLLLLMLPYLYLTRRGLAAGEQGSRRRLLLFSLGVAALYVASGTPVHDVSECCLLSVHMFQHFFFTVVAPPLLLLGTPPSLLRPLLRRRTVAAVARFVTRPWMAFVAFNLVLVATHLPPVMDLALRQHQIHGLFHAVILTTALLTWWPVLSPLPELPRLSYPLQMLYLFFQTLIPGVLAVFPAFSELIVYSFYETAPRLVPVSPLEDQQLAAGVMKVLTSLVLWSFMGYAFFHWYRQEAAGDSELLTQRRGDPAPGDGPPPALPVPAAAAGAGPSSLPLS